MTSWGKTDPRDLGCAHSESGGWASLFLTSFFTGSVLQLEMVCSCSSWRRYKWVRIPLVSPSALISVS